MQGTIFVNDAISYAINLYLSSKSNPNSEEYNSFYSNIIKALIFIYGELDIINPYKTNHVSGMGGFDDNLKKYGLNNLKLDNFKNSILKYHQEESDVGKAKYFVEIQKLLIDMLFCKANHIFMSDEEIEQFKQFLYFKEDQNNFKLTLYSKLIPNNTEVMDYLSSKIFIKKHDFNFTEYKNITLIPEAYQLAGYNIVEVMKMSDEEIHNVNNKVYHFFRIRNNDLNKKQRLETAVNFYKKYGKMFTSGNGFVDTLLLSSIIATFSMFLVMIVIKFVS